MRTSRWVVLIGFAGYVSPAGVAHADVPPAEPTTQVPGFVTIDRADGHSFVEVGGSMSFYEGEDPDFNARVDLYGQYVTPSGAGGYATLPVGFIADNDDSETALGNLEFGGIFNLQQGAKTSIVFRGGLTLPTADDDDLSEAIVRYATLFGRLTDLTSSASDITWLRFAASPIYHEDNLFLRADGGFDVPIDKPEGSTVDPLVRLNLGAGFTNGSVAVMGEFVTIGTTGDVDENEDRFLNTLALSVRGGVGSPLEGFAALVVPIDVEDTLIDVDFVLVAGVRVPIGP